MSRQNDRQEEGLSLKQFCEPDVSLDERPVTHFTLPENAGLSPGDEEPIRRTLRGGL